MTTQLEAKPEAKQPEFVTLVPERAAPYKFKELRETLEAADNKFVPRAADNAAGEAFCKELYGLLKDVSETDQKYGVSETQKRLESATVFTEIARTRHVVYAQERSRLSNTKELARWHSETAAVILNVLRLDGSDKARGSLANFWEIERKIFTKDCPAVPPAELTAAFERHKAGVLAAVAFEESLAAALPDWKMEPANERLDAGRAIDYKLTSLDGNTFFIQLTSTTKDDVPPADVMEFTAKQKPAHLSAKEARFWRGVNTYVLNKRLDPEKVRAAYVTLSSEYYDSVTGAPSSALEQDLKKPLDRIDATGSWSSAVATISHRLPR